MKNTHSYTAVALGFFDGVHLGHQKILKETVKYEEKNVIPIVYTFRQSPKQVLGDKNYFYLTSNLEKTNLFFYYGIKKVYMDDFINIKDLSCQQFVYEVLKVRLNAKYTVCGENFRFGKNADGDSHILKKICKQYDIESKIVPMEKYNENFISSSRIKKSLLSNSLRDVKFMLGNKKVTDAL